MALTLFVMAILSQAFVTALDTFRGLKAIGDMQSSLRVATSSLRRDLAQHHFEGARKLSDPQINSERPRQGYFFVRHGSTWQANPAPYYHEGNDADGLPSYRAIDHVMAFTVRLQGNKREDYLRSPDIPYFPGPPPIISPLSKTTTNFWDQPRDGLFNPAPVPLTNPDTYASQWAEVNYFLWPGAVTTNGVQLFDLYRSQYLLVPNPSEANDGKNSKNQTLENVRLVNEYYYSGVSCFPELPIPNNYLIFNAPEHVADQTPVTTPTKRTVGMDRRALPHMANDAVSLPLTSGLTFYGSKSGMPRNSSLVVPNVISFQIQLLYAANPAGFVDVQPLTLQNNANPPRIYDTTLPSSTMPNIQLLGLKITIRVHDPVSQLSRQMSLVQDL